MGGKVFYFEPSFSGQIQSLVRYLNDPSPDVEVHICLSLGYTPTGDMLGMNDIFCTRPEKPKALEPFADVQPQIEQMKHLPGRLQTCKQKYYHHVSLEQILAMIADSPN